MRYLVSILIYLCLSLPVHAQDINAGFVQGLWYSSNEIIEGVPIRVYAALRNNTEHDLVGTVRFTDNGIRIGSSQVSALSGRLVETWIDWTPGEGEHALSAFLSDAELHVVGGEIIQANVEQITISDTVLADIDTDNDGIGNKRDTDDDNDMVSDEDEVARGTNPLVAQAVPELIEQEEVPPAQSSTSDEEGLEKYLDEGTAHSVLSTISDKVSDANDSLNAYRESRNTDRSMEITRSIPGGDQTFLQSFVSGVASLLSSIYTLILFILSKILAHPAVIQIGLLLLILYTLYRTARGLGRRPS